MDPLALYIGLSPSTISKARLDQRRPEPETVIRLAKYFQVDEAFSRKSKPIPFGFASDKMDKFILRAETVQSRQLHLMGVFHCEVL